MNTQIYIMTHKKIPEISNKIYIPLHVGKEGKADLGYLGDNSGENISQKNDNYCELTGLYWLWKNVKCDIIGICHYRRFFIKNDKLLDKSYIEQTINQKPIIIPNSSCAQNQTVYEQYHKMHHSTKDLEICREIIAVKYPEYLPAFDYYKDCILLSVGNMWITKKDIYDRYCSWLFDILFEAEKKIDLNNYDEYQKRVMGFLSERLFRVWLFMQPEAITEEYVKLIDLADLINVEKRVHLIFQQTRLKLMPILNLYTSATIKGSLAENFHCNDDFDGKIPIWICWWQGEKKMPDLIRICFESVKRNLPDQNVVLRLITLENCMDYVTFTETIIRKFNEGKITYSQLSDILRAELLFRYGGMWINASYYAAVPIPPYIFEQTAFTLKLTETAACSDLTQGKWTRDLWYTVKGKKLFQFLMESLWYYWETEDSVLDPDFIDYIIAVAMDNFSDVKTELTECGFSSENAFLLHNMMNRKYTKERAEQIHKEFTFYKLNWKADYREENLIGEQTMYGYLLKHKNTT